MILAAVVVMTVLGCGDQAKSCDMIAEPKRSWQSIQKCDAAIPAVLRRSMNSPYPVITAQCDVKDSPAVLAQPKSPAVMASQAIPADFDRESESKALVSAKNNVRMARAGQYPTPPCTEPKMVTYWSVVVPWTYLR